MRVAVVGGGVIGVTSALAIKDAFPGYKVDIFADEFSPNTTGDGSAGLWGPYLHGDTPVDNILRWSGITHRWLSEFWKSGLSPEAGVCLLPMYRVTSSPEGLSSPFWIETVHGAHKLTPKELRKLNEENRSKYTDGYHFVTYTAEPIYLLPWLMKKFVSAGGGVRKRKISALHELIEEGYDLIINCTGLGARDLIGDETVTSIRGQVVRVKSPWMMTALIEEDDVGNYIIPNIESTILGGTHQEGDFDTIPRKEDSKFIYEGCTRISPSLKQAEIIKEWAGLRPGRPKVRLEPEVLRTPNGRKFTVIHNYGHGGSGVTLCWGCALDVVEMTRKLSSQLKSNL